MIKKKYIRPHSGCECVRTEQGICYSSGVETTMKTDEADTDNGIVVDPYEEIDNNIEFE